MRQRENRQTVLIRARMNVDGRWSDACILNMSTRGLGCQAADPPLRGAYLEIRRGSHVIVGRVVWSSTRRFGVAAQGRLPVAAIVNDEAPMAAAAFIPGSGRDRRSPSRPADRAESSRLRGRMIEFGAIVAGISAVAGIGFGIVRSALEAPMASISGALGGAPGDARR